METVSNEDLLKTTFILLSDRFTYTAISPTKGTKTFNKSYQIKIHSPVSAQDPPSNRRSRVLGSCPEGAFSEQSIFCLQILLPVAQHLACRTSTLYPRLSTTY
jgi:hypothetical protein